MATGARLRIGIQAERPNNGGGNTFAVTISSGGVDTVALDISPTIDSLVLGQASGGNAQLVPASAQTLTINNGLTVNQTGILDLERGSTLTAATVSNSGIIETNAQNNGSGLTNILTVAGAFTNNAELSSI